MTTPPQHPPPPDEARGLWPLRAFYLCSFGALGALFPYLPLLLASRRLDDAEISWVMVLVPIFNLATPPLWGALADALRARLQLLRLASAMCGLAVLLLLPDWGFTGALAAVACISLFRAPQTSLADAATYAVTGTRRADYATVRVWGSLGFAVCVLGLGYLEGSLNPPLLVGITCAIYLLSAAATLPIRTAPIARTRGVVRQTRHIVSRGPMLAFLAANILYYAGHATYDAYFSLYMGKLGFGDGFVGVAWAIGVTVEIGVMFGAPLLHHRVRSSLWLALCSVVAAGRWLLLSIVTGAAPLLCLQALHGVTFGLWYLSMVRYIQTRAPTHLRTSLQSVTTSAMGAGMVAGYLGGGQLLHHLGPHVLYRASATAAALSLLFYLLAARR